ncbi:hypothetical protein Anas_12162 [Armadillidium nasatum]|uniref:Uncharacterized protein n=1 Tax=Armadillidium nasatum TaxID=96803 RepID=A0A5N5T5K4_9CRUS|nr:hypothetical protein Anas_12162 [Armadillidium nasatum]
MKNLKIFKMGLKLQICFVFLGFLLSTMANPVLKKPFIRFLAANPERLLGNISIVQNLGRAIVFNRPFLFVLIVEGEIEN